MLLNNVTLLEQLPHKDVLGLQRRVVAMHAERQQGSVRLSSGNTALTGVKVF